LISIKAGLRHSSDIADIREKWRDDHLLLQCAQRRRGRPRCRRAL